MTVPSMKIKMGEKEVDLAKSWPLNIRDLKHFKASGLMDDAGNIDTADLGQLEAMLLHLCQKVDEDITPEDVELIDVIALKDYGEWMERVSKDAGLDIDRPTSTPSTSSPPSGGGPSET